MNERSSIRVLIADDSQVIRERLIRLLADLEGIEIIGEAKDGNEALGLITDKRPDVVVLDIWMPDKNGIEVLKTIRLKDQSTTIIMLSNDASVQHRLRCLKDGANYFLHKSKDFEKLLEILEGLITQRELQKPSTLPAPEVFE